MPDTRTHVSPLPGTLRRDIAGIVGGEHLITDPDRLLVYESDGLTQYRFAPSAVVLPGSGEELAEVVRALHRAGQPFVPRGAGTGLSGGALAPGGAVVVGTARLNRILEVDAANRRARVEPGVINASLTRATLPHGLIYAPDPSSQSACTLGGNVAENSGGPHCLKYGVTSRYVTALEVVLPDGHTVELDGPDRGWAGPDWMGLFVGSEGCFGIVSEIEVALIPAAEGVRTLLGIFDTLEDAGRAVTAIMAQGLLPAALEIVDRETIRAVEASIFAAGYPTSAGAALVVELDGVDAGLDAEVALVEACCRNEGATEVRIAQSAAERTALWAGRKKAFGAMGRIAPDLLVQDATVPRSRLPDVLARIGEIGERYRLKVANVFHAGDGNLHPNLLFDRRDADELARVEAASREIMTVCIEAGGTITGEHGVGMDKRAYMERVLSPAVLHQMARVRTAIDPAGLCNPGKVLPDTLPDLLPLPDDPLPEGVLASTLEEMAARVSEAPDGGSSAEGTPPIVVESAEHASALLAAASRERVPVRIEGSDRGAFPATHVHLVTSALSGVVEHSPSDLTVTVGAGTTLGELQRAVRESGQWFPLDPPGGDRITLGQAMATGAAGPLQAGYGRLRDHLLGTTVVTGEGRVLDLGGRVVKNVAGFDLVRLAVGSRGTLGLITRLTLRLFPLPEVDRTLFWDEPRGEASIPTADMASASSSDPVLDGIRLGRRLVDTGVPLSALEWGWRLPGATAGRVATRLHGSAATVEAMTRRLQDVAGPPTGTLDGAASIEWWSERADREGGGTVTTTLSTLPERAEAVVAASTGWREAGGSLSLHLISGGLRLDLDPGSDDASDPVDHLRAIRTVAGVAARQEEAFAEVVRTFDPQGILAGNRSVGWP